MSRGFAVSFVFLIGSLAGVGLTRAWIQYSDSADGPVSARSREQLLQEVIERNREFELIASRPPEDVPEALRPNWNEEKQLYNNMSVQLWQPLFTPQGFILKHADPQVRQYLLDKANEEVCLKCGEVNPATRAKGYPPESCHKCCIVHHIAIEDAAYKPTPEQSQYPRHITLEEFNKLFPAVPYDPAKEVQSAN